MPRMTDLLTKCTGQAKRKRDEDQGHFLRRITHLYCGEKGIERIVSVASIERIVNVASKIMHHRAMLIALFLCKGGFISLSQFVSPLPV